MGVFARNLVPRGPDFSSAWQKGHPSLLTKRIAASGNEIGARCIVFTAHTSLFPHLQWYLGTSLGMFLQVCYVACSKTLYFLFKVSRTRVIKYKPEGIYWPPAQAGSGGGFLLALRSRSCALASLATSPMFSKRTKTKIKQRLCTG